MSRLTRFPYGSLGELIAITSPLLISNLSFSIMQLCDRILIARFNLDLIAGVMIANTLASTLSYAFTGITSISASFAGQYNGAKQYKKTCIPIWQMVYFSLSLSLITVPLGLFGLDFIASEELHKTKDYFTWVMSSAFLVPLGTAISCFFMSIGNTKIITYTSIISNTVNIILDVLFIFGYPNVLSEFDIVSDEINSHFIPAMGAKGAIIATVLSQIIQITVLVLVMLKHKYRTKYDTLNFTFDKKLIIECIKIGFPNAISRFLETLAWSSLSIIIGNFSKIHIRVFTLSSNVWLAFQFIFFAIQAGLSTTIANHIGAKRFNIIGKSIFSAITFFASIMLVCVPVLAIFPDFAIAFFTGGSDDIDRTLSEHLVISFNFTYIAIIIESINIILTGVLVAGCDTKFVMLVNPTLAWILGFIPCFLAIKLGGFPPYFTVVFAYPYMIVVFFIYIWRYKSGKWIKKII